MRELSGAVQITNQRKKASLTSKEFIAHHYVQGIVSIN
jgi:hypothetical protein